METTQQSLQIVKPSSDVAASASAALAKATIEAKFTIALHRPRSELVARQKILDACKRPAFADGALYRVKRGRIQLEDGRWVDNYIEGLSIRFAETALNSWRNVDVAAVTAWENEDVRLVRISVTDLESNLSYTDEVLLQKTQERSKLREGQEAIATRTNSDGKTVYIVRCTEDDLLLKLNAAKSKAIRNSGLRLIPQDILEEAETAIRETREKGGGDPLAETKKICDAFAKLGVNPTELEMYLGHGLSSISPKELADLRAIYTTVKDGEASWSDYTRKEPEPDAQGNDAPPPKSPPPPPSRGRPPAGKPQEVIADILTQAGFTFDQLQRWGLETGNIPSADSLSSYSELPDEVAVRLVRARKGLIEQLTAAKGGAA